MQKDNLGFKDPFFEHFPVRIAHRGASAEAPENTIPAIDLAIRKYKVDMVEVDLRLTQEGIPVVFHDETLERVTNGRGLVRKHSLQELKQLDVGLAGVKIPTLEEILTTFPETKFCLEVKDKGVEVVSNILRAIERSPRKAPLLIGSFDGKIANELKRLAPREVEGIFSAPEAIKGYLAFRLGFKKFSFSNRFAFSPCERYQIRLDRPRWIEFLHRQGIRVCYWTINEIPEMERLLKNGADGIITDYPDRLNKLLGCRGDSRIAPTV
ncbi:MAG: hypothetical protein HY447_03115 [Candidatus Omnitrophica bacterium]|nr:hypothetical protein [Candidatus Omnitrophota bacterium]